MKAKRKAARQLGDITGLADIQGMIADRRPDLLREASDLITLTGIRAAPAIGPPLVAPVALGPGRDGAEGLGARLGVAAFIVLSAALLALAIGLFFSKGGHPRPAKAPSSPAMIVVKSTGVDRVAAIAAAKKEMPASNAALAVGPVRAPTADKAARARDGAAAKAAAARAPRDRSLPVALTREQVSKGFRAVGPTVKRRCEGTGSGVVVVEAVISGSGRISRARAADTGATSAGKCVARAVKRARFPRFGGDPITVRYPFVL